MIYFIQNTNTKAVKIGYSNNAQKRLVSLQTANPDELVMLGTVQGGLEHEAAYHEKFAKHTLRNEWFTGDILGEVQAIIAKAAANPEPLKTNVIVAGDSDAYYIFSSSQEQMAERRKLEAGVMKALEDVNAKTPIAWVITGGERLHDNFAWDWANKNKVQIQRYYPNWKKHGRYAGFKTGPQMLRAQFHPKLLLVFIKEGKASSNTKSLIRRAEKAKIEAMIIER